MPITLNREAFLNCLETVQPGISPRDVVDQSSCFAFKNGEVCSFSDEVFCRRKTELKGKFEGAVKAEKLLNMLRKFNEDELELDAESEEGYVVFTGKKRRQFAIRMEKEILLPIDTVEKPKKWKALHEDFTKAIGICGQCAGTDQSEYSLTCLHIHPEWVEACDRFQICRWPMSTDVDESTLVRQSSVKHITSLGMTEFSLTDSWMHFRNNKGLELSCRRTTNTSDFEDLGRFLDVKGAKATLPKALVAALDKAEEFTKEHADANRVFVKLRSGKLLLKGLGITGWYREPFKITYDGPEMDFLISTVILKDIVTSHSDCVIAKDRLAINTGEYAYAACLLVPEEEKKEEAKQEQAMEEE